MSTIVCPVCNRNDAMQKASAVVSSGTGTSGGLGAATALAQKLAPPSEPTMGCDYWLIILTFGLPGFTSLLLIFLGGGKWRWDLEEIVGGFVLGVLFPAIAVGAYLHWDRVERPPQQEAFNKAMLKWSRLYYCSRDDIVVDPQTGGTCRPDSLRGFLLS